MIGYIKADWMEGLKDALLNEVLIRMRHDMILNVDIPDRVAVSYRLPINDSA
jgi:hypothetical protein